jgi:hypothetical protein
MRLLQPRSFKERVAQLVEHLTFNQRVMGSNPIALTIKINRLHQFSHIIIEPYFCWGNTWGNKTAALSQTLSPRRLALSPLGQLKWVLHGPV